METDRQNQESTKIKNKDSTNITINEFDETVGSTGNGKTSILDIDLTTTMTSSFADILRSPRTLEAMANLGILGSELDDHSYDTIRLQLCKRERKQTIPSMIVDLRYDNFQKKRQVKRQLIIDERQKIINQSEFPNNNSMFNSQYGQHSQFGEVKHSLPPPEDNNDYNNSQEFRRNQAFRNAKSPDQSHYANLIASPQGTAHADRRTISQEASGLRNTMYNQSHENKSSMLGALQPIPSITSSRMGSSAPRGMSMVEQEMRQLEKIKMKQKKEVEQMIDYEVKLVQIKKKNEEKAVLQAAKELRQAAELRKKKQLQEEKKVRDDEKRQAKAEQEAENQRQRNGQLKKREQDNALKQMILEQQREQDRIFKEEMRLKKREEQEADQRRKQREQEEAAKARSEELQRRDLQRIRFRERQNRERIALSLTKARDKNKKIEAAKEQAEATIQKQRKIFKEREAHAELKRGEFEKQRSLDREIIKKKGVDKANLMKKIFYESQLIEKQKKDKILLSRAEADKRQKVLLQQQEKQIHIKKQQNEERQKYQFDVRIQNERSQKVKVDTLLKTRNDKAVQMAKTQQMREWEMFVKKEMEMIKREDRLENVERISRANAHQQNKIMLKIEADKVKADKIAKEKAEMLLRRQAMRRKAEEEKVRMMEKVEEMKQQGNFNKEQLAEFGITVQPEMDTVPSMNPIDQSQISIFNSRSNMSTKRSLKQIQNKEMQNLVTKEEKEKQAREQQIYCEEGEMDKDKLIRNNDLENRVAASRINNLEKDHKQEIIDFDQKSQNQVVPEGKNIKKDFFKTNNVESETELMKQEHLDELEAKSQPELAMRGSQRQKQAGYTQQKMSSQERRQSFQKLGAGSDIAPVMDNSQINMEPSQEIEEKTEHSVSEVSDIAKPNDDYKNAMKNIDIDEEAVTPIQPQKKESDDEYSDDGEFDE